MSLPSGQKHRPLVVFLEVNGHCDGTPPEEEEASPNMPLQIFKKKKIKNAFFLFFFDF